MDENLKKQNRKISIIAIIIIILIIVAGVIYAYIVTDFFKTPDQLFKKYLIGSYIQISEFNLEPYGDTLKRVSSEPTSFTFETKTDLSLDQGYDLIFGQNKIEIDTKGTLKIDVPNKNSILSLETKNNNENFFSFDILKSDNIYGIYVPEISDKYIAVENRDLKKIAETLELDQETIDMIPNTIPEISIITEEENVKLLELGSKYINKVLEQIDSTFYTKEKYAIRNFDGETINGTKYILTISEINFNNIMKNIYKELMQDQEFLILIEEKLPKETIDNLKEDANSLKILETDENAGNIVISIYESDGETVRFKYEEESKKSAQFTLVNKENSSHLVAEILTSKTEENLVGSETIIDLTNKFENNQGELILQFKNTYNQNDISLLREEKYGSIFSSFFLGTENNSQEYDLDKYKNTDVTYKLTSSATENKIDSTLTFDGIDLAKYFSEQKIFLNMSLEPSIDIPKLTDNNKIIVNDYSKEDFTNLGTEMITNIMTNSSKNPNSLFGIYFGALSLYQQSLQSIQ